LFPSILPFGVVQLTLIPDPGVEEVPVPVSVKERGRHRNRASGPALAVGCPGATPMVIVSVPLTLGSDKSMTVKTILPADKFLMALPEPRFLPVARDIQL